MWYLFKHNKFLSVATVCTVIAILVVVVTGRTISLRSYQIQEIRNTTLRNQMMIDSLNKQLDIYRGSFDEKARSIMRVRPSQERLIEFLDAIERSADTAGVQNFSLQSIERSTVYAIDLTQLPYPQLTYKATFHATPYTLRRFFSQLDSLPQYLEITEFSFHQNKESSLLESGDVILNFNLFTR